MSLRDEIAEAERKCSKFMEYANLASERGEKEKSERWWTHAQKWYDRINELEGKA